MNSKIERVLEIFTDINNIPRKSKNEKEISDWLVTWAEKNSFTVIRDEFLDVLITVPATKGYEKKDSITIQGHMDMVCEKTPESNHDFSKDAINMYVEDGWLKARNTSLGADNGIALAIAMALATDQEVKHPKLELLFTVDEETGLTGAVNLQSNWLQSKKLINIDSEDEGVFTIGCAGGRDAKISLHDKKTVNSKFDSSLYIEIGGLKGGHSGVEIHLEKGNSNIILARLLKEITQNEVEFGISEFSGGSAHNAIPRNSSATFAINKKDVDKCRDILTKQINMIKREFSVSDPDITLEIKKPLKVDSYRSTKIIDLILSLPHGVLYNSKQMDGIVETSCNLAVISIDETGFNILMSQRSSVMSRLDEVCNKIDAVVSLSGGSVEFGGGYPSWQPDFDSKLLEDFKRCYKDIFHKEPVIEVIHAGLECGVIGAKYPGMEMISIGPTIESPHCPDEKMLITTILDIWDLLVKYLKN